jgi:hypothetical protein
MLDGGRILHDMNSYHDRNVISQITDRDMASTDTEQGAVVCSLAHGGAGIPLPDG